MQTILITGATSGIGLVIARFLYQQGYNVFGTSRTPEKYTGAFPFEILRLDLNDEATIVSCVQEVCTRTGRVDVLINNAGMGVCGTAEETSLEQAYRQVETNFWGAVRVTRAVLPVMRRQHSGRIITIGSLAGIIGVPCQSYYSASKHALEGFFKTLRIEVRPFNIKVSLIEPGFFRSNLHHAFEYADPVIGDYDLVRKNSLAVLNDSIDKAGTPDPIARIIARTLKMSSPGFSYRVGKNSFLAPLLQFLCYRLYEAAVRRNFRL